LEFEVNNLFVPKNVKAVFDRLKCISANSEKLSTQNESIGNSNCWRTWHFNVSVVIFCPPVISGLDSPLTWSDPKRNFASWWALAARWPPSGRSSSTDCFPWSTAGGRQRGAERVSKRRNSNGADGRPAVRRRRGGGRATISSTERRTETGKNAKTRVQNFRGRLFSRKFNFYTLNGTKPSGSFRRRKTVVVFRIWDRSRLSRRHPPLSVGRYTWRFGRSVRRLARSRPPVSAATINTARAQIETPPQPRWRRAPAVRSLSQTASKRCAARERKRSAFYVFFRGSRYGVPFRLPGPKIACSSTVR